MPVRSSRLVPLAAPAALALAAWASAAWYVDATDVAPTLFLGLFAAGALAPLAATASPSSRVVPVAAAAALLPIAFLPRAGPLPMAAVALALVAAIGFSVAERARRFGSRGAGRGWPSILGLALAAQWVAAGHRVIAEPLAASTLVVLIGIPLVVAGALTALAGNQPRAALALALATFAAGPGWSAAGVAALAAAVVASRSPWLGARPPAVTAALVALAVAPLAAAGPAWLVVAVAAAVAAALAPPGRLVAAGATALGLAACGALAAGALPWRAERALASAFGALVERPFSMVATPIEVPGRALTSTAPVFEAPLDVGPVRALTLVTYLTNSVALPCGTPVARAELLDGGRAVAEARLEVGRDSAEWAAARPDVARVLACPAPAPSWSWVPTAGRFLGSSFRARFALERPVDVDTLRLVRDPDLAPDVAVAVSFAGVER